MINPIISDNIPPTRNPNLLSALIIEETPKLTASPIGIKIVETPSEKKIEFSKAFSPTTFGKIGFIKKRLRGHSPAVRPKTTDETIDSNILR